LTLANPIDLQSFEDVVWDWFSESIEAEVIWTHQSAPRPDYPYGTLNIIAGPIAAGPFEQKTSTDLARPAGQEVEFEVRVPCTMTVSCQVHVNIPDSRDPGHYARTLAARAQSRLYLPTVQETFRAANCAVQRVDTFTNISTVVNDGNVSRIGMDVVFNAALSLTEYTGYIKKTHITSNPELGIDQEFGDI
jgi:hypothetical protein